MDEKGGAPVCVISRAEINDLDSLVWMARKSHFRGPYEWAQFRPGMAKNTLRKELDNPQAFVIILRLGEAEGFIYCRALKPRFIRDNVVDVIDYWFDPGLATSRLLAPKLWLALTTWASGQKAARLTWRLSTNAWPAAMHRTCVRFGATRDEGTAEFLSYFLEL